MKSTIKGKQKILLWVQIHFRWEAELVFWYYIICCSFLCCLVAARPFSVLSSALSYVVFRGSCLADCIAFLPSVLCTVCYKWFALLSSVIGMIRSMIVAIPGHLLFYWARVDSMKVWHIPWIMRLTRCLRLNRSRNLLLSYQKIIHTSAKTRVDISF